MIRVYVSVEAPPEYPSSFCQSTTFYCKTEADAYVLVNTIGARASGKLWVHIESLHEMKQGFWITGAIVPSHEVVKRKSDLPHSAV